MANSQTPHRNTLNSKPNWGNNQMGPYRSKTVRLREKNIHLSSPSRKGMGH